MKSTGIVRKIDNLGRIVLPKELRRSMKIGENDPMEIYTDDQGQIILKPEKVSCAFCGSSGPEVQAQYKQGHVCSRCLDGLRRM